MKLFPDEVLLGTMASAQLIGIEKLSGSLVGRFQLQPRDTVEFLDRVGSLDGYFGVRYAPVPGMWASFVVPEDRDDVDLLIGVESCFGRAIVGACDALKIPGRTLVSEPMIRTLAMGYLSRVEG